MHASEPPTADGPAPRLAQANMLAVTAGGEKLYLPAPAIREIIRPGAITRVPNTPASLLGVINLRGVVVPVLSLAALLGLPPHAAAPSSRIVILRQGSLFGVWVDQVQGLAATEGLEPVPLQKLLSRDFSILLHPMATHAAAPVKTADPPHSAQARTELLVAFSIATQTYAMRLAEVALVTSVPHAALATTTAGAELSNLVTIKGQLMRLMDLRAVLGLPAAARAGTTLPVIVARAAGRPVALVVDRMHAVLRVHPDWIDDVPPLLNNRATDTRIAAICRIDGGSRLAAILSAASLFGAAAPDTTEASPPSPTAALGAAEERLVVFRIGTESFALPAHAVDEVLRRPAAITPIPNAPDFIDGIMNLRGTPVAVIGQRRRFGAPAEPDATLDRTQAQRIVMVRVDGQRAGFRVDAVSSMLSAAQADLLAVPPLAPGQAPLFDRMACLEHGERTILLINPRTLLNEAARDMLAAFHRAAPGLAAA